MERPWTVVTEDMDTSHVISPTFCLLSLVLLIVIGILFCDMDNIKVCSSCSRHLLTIVQSESMKPALQRGDILISFPIQLDAGQLTATYGNKELVAKGDIILLEVSISKYLVYLYHSYYLIESNSFST